MINPFLYSAGLVLYTTMENKKYTAERGRKEDAW